MLRTSCQARRTISCARRFHRAFFVDAGNPCGMRLSCMSRACARERKMRDVMRAARRATASDSSSDRPKSAVKIFFVSRRGIRLLETRSRPESSESVVERFARTSFAATRERIEPTESTHREVGERVARRRSAPRETSDVATSASADACCRVGERDEPS
jgi:hypothetical protein